MNIICHESRHAPDLMAWSPLKDRLANAGTHGLRVYVVRGGRERVQHRNKRLSQAPFVDAVWSPSGRYLAARRADGMWCVYAESGGQYHVIYANVASSMDWADDDQLIYVPESGGLVLVNLRNEGREVVLSG